MTLSSVTRLAGVAVLSLALSGAVLAQTGSEQQLLAQVGANPQQVGALIDLARLYHQQGRLDEAEAMLTRALFAVRDLRVGRQAEPDTTGLVGADGGVRVGGSIQQPIKVRDVRPVYPQEAQDAKVSGIVIAEIRVDTDGSVADATVLRSVPMLDEAALDAIRQWRYAPTVLNGVAVPVIMTVTVNFTLSQD